MSKITKKENPMISILVLTLNEENNIQNCLDSVSWSNDVIVLDSGSTDKTVKIAKANKARVFQHPFQHFADQQNWALQKINFKNPWVFYLDADERMTQQLKEEIISISNDSSIKEVGFFVGRKNYLWGKWLKHSFPPGYVFRFLNQNWFGSNQKAMDHRQ